MKNICMIVLLTLIRVQVYIQTVYITNVYVIVIIIHDVHRSFKSRSTNDVRTILRETIHNITSPPHIQSVSEHILAHNNDCAHMCTYMLFVISDLFI